jgi:aspartate aminotransferase
MPQKNLFSSIAPPVLELQEAQTFKYADMASQLARTGKEILSFGIGQPDFPTPPHIVDAAINALHAGFTRYVSPPGIPELRHEIARHVSAFTGAADVKPTETLVTPGAKLAMFFAIATFVSPGDEVIIPDPSFYSYAHAARYAGGTPVFLPLREETEFSLTPDAFQAAITRKTRMVILNSPHNPTGGMLTKSDFKGILELAKEKGILVASDEIYDHYTYAGGFMSALEDPDWRDYVIHINSLSKTYAMTGWRLGYVVASEEVINRFNLFTANTVSCTTSFVQKAGVAALSGPQAFFQKILSEYRARRDFMYRELAKIPGIRVKKPSGAFFIFPNVKAILEGMKMSTAAFAIRLLKETGIVVLPGPAFPHEAGTGYLRFSYALPIEQIERGLKRFKASVTAWTEQTT